MFVKGEEVGYRTVLRRQCRRRAKQSVAYSIPMRAQYRMVTDNESDKAIRAALAALEKDFEAVLRG